MTVNMKSYSLMTLNLIVEDGFSEEQPLEAVEEEEEPEKRGEDLYTGLTQEEKALVQV